MAFLFICNLFSFLLVPVLLNAIQGISWGYPVFMISRERCLSKSLIIKSQSHVISRQYFFSSDVRMNPNDSNDDIAYHSNDTIRVRIWRALANYDELTLKQLGALVGEKNLGDLQSHLDHVLKQAKTFQNKSDEWKRRRDVLFVKSVKDSVNVGESLKLNNTDTFESDTKLRKRVKITKRRGTKGNIFIRME